MIYRAGAVVAEGFWTPYAGHHPHMLHSAVKSWTGTAVGLAIGDGLLRLTDKVVSFFPEHLPVRVSDNLAAMTVQDLLTMRSGHRTGSSGGEWRALTESWVSLFLNEEVAEPPGQAFIYSSGSSYMLSAIVTKVTGKTVHALLDERVFRPLGCGRMTWDISPEGFSTGGDGLSCTLEDMLKFGVLYLHDGVWEGRRLLPEGWVAQATHNHVRDIRMAPLDGRRFLARDAVPESALQKRDDYGFQWWMTPHGGYRANGLFGQYLTVLPAQDAVIAINAAVPYGETGLSEAMWQHLLPALSGVPGDPAAERCLADELAQLALPMPVGGPRSPIEAVVSGRTFAMAPNADGVDTIGFDFSADCCQLRLTDGRGTHMVTVGLANPIEGHTTMTGAKLHHAYEPGHLRVVATGSWLDAATFSMTWRFVETAFSDTVVCRFDGDQLRWDRCVNVNPGGTSRPTVTGRLI